MKRCRVRFLGLVQGVGFRQTTAHVARGYAVTGYVQNEPDGSVLLVVEGEEEEVTSMIEQVRERMEGRIREAAQAWSGATGEFLEFKVRY